MKKIIVALLTIATLIPSACNDNSCDCQSNWNDTLTYETGDLVLYHDTCWAAVAQGKGIIPGKWLSNGNDIWVMCDE